MDFNYPKLQAQAHNLLVKAKAQPCKITYLSSGSSKSTIAIADVTETKDFDVNVVSKVTDKQQKLLVSAKGISIDPIVGDSIKWLKQDYQIRECKPIKPATVTVYYEIIIDRT